MWISIILLMRVNILYCQGNLEYMYCLFYNWIESMRVVCFRLLMQDYFWSSASLARIGYGDSCSACAPTRTWFYHIMIVVWIFEEVSVLCMEYYKGYGFLNDSIQSGDAFIFVFEADEPVINNWENFHRKKIKQASFLYFNPFIGTVIHKSNFRVILKF